MSYLPFTILAYLLNSISVTVDKFLLTKNIPNPIVYVFYISAFSLITLFLLPFTHIPTSQVFLLASLSTIFWTLGVYLMFKALQIGQVSRVIPVIGTLIPIFLLIEASTTATVTNNQTWAVIILILGMFFLTIVDWKGRIRKKELICEFFSALLFAISYVILRDAYLHDSFLTVFSWSKLILIPIGSILIAFPNMRKIIFSTQGPKRSFFSRVGLLFLVGQIAGGVSGLLLTYAVSLASPALVNSLQGVQYAFLFIFSLILARKFPDVYKERLSRLTVFTKIIGITFIGFGLYILAFFGETYTPKMAYGVTYSPRYAEQLGLDPMTIYSQMLTDLHPKLLRLPIYWDDVEKNPGEFNFSEIDKYVDLASQQNAGLVISVGFKEPRWPECYAPTWAKNLDQVNKDQSILDLVKAEVSHFKDNPHIIAWQVENEPYLGFGECPDPKYNVARLPKEVAAVKELDLRPILITDSGELGGWAGAMKNADIFGMTMYRKVWSPYFGDTEYPVPPFYYSIKDQVAKSFSGSSKKTSIISELQVEPWQKQKLDLKSVSIDDQIKLFSVTQFKNNVAFARQTGFNQAYLWGVEWWYFMRDRDHSEYLDYAKELFSD